MFLLANRLVSYIEGVVSNIYINELCCCMDSLSEAPFVATLASNGLRDAVCPLL